MGFARDLAATPLHAYREGTLTLRVSSIGWGPLLSRIASAGRRFSAASGPHVSYVRGLAHAPSCVIRSPTLKALTTRAPAREGIA